MMNYETAGNAIKITFDKRPSSQLAGFLVNTLGLKWDKGKFTTYSGTLSNRDIGFIQFLEEIEKSVELKNQVRDSEMAAQTDPVKDEVSGGEKTLPFAEEYLRELTFGDSQKNYDDFIQDKKENQQEKPDAIRRESQHPENALKHPDSQMKQKAGISEESAYEKKVQASTRELLTDDNFKRFLENGISFTGSGAGEDPEFPRQPSAGAELVKAGEIGEMIWVRLYWFCIVQRRFSFYAACALL